MSDNLEHIVRELQQMGIGPAAAQQAVHLGARTVEEAVGMLFSEDRVPAAATPLTAAPATAASLGAARDGPWEEHFSSKDHGRPFYHNPTAGITLWDEPEVHRKQRHQIDVEVFSVPLPKVQQVHSFLDKLLSLPPQLQPLGADSRPSTPSTSGLSPVCKTLLKITTNIVENPAAEKFRTLKKSNATFTSKVWGIEPAKLCLLECGFVESGDAVIFPSQAPIESLRLAVARLQAVEEGLEKDRQGHERSQSGESSGAARYQKEVWHCGRCNKFINDGSERVFTRRHDAPKGEFRYQCTTCERYSVCEKCWDEMQAGKWCHTAGHQFEHVHPIESQHNTSVHGVGPWGNFGGGMSARGRERLRERTGL